MSKVKFRYEVHYFNADGSQFEHFIFKTKKEIKGFHERHPEYMCHPFVVIDTDKDPRCAAIWAYRDALVKKAVVGRA